MTDKFYVDGWYYRVEGEAIEMGTVHFGLDIDKSVV